MVYSKYLAADKPCVLIKKTDTGPELDQGPRSSAGIYPTFTRSQETQPSRMAIAFSVDAAQLYTCMPTNSCQNEW